MALLGEQQRLWRNLLNLPRVFEAARDVRVGATPSTVVLEAGTHRLLGYAMGGTLATLYGALNPDAVKTLTLLAAPIDFASRESLLNLWVRGGVFDVDRLLTAYGNCPAWFLQSIFLWMNPVRNFVDKGIAFWEQMNDPAKVTATFALEHWLNDNIPVAGA